MKKIYFLSILLLISIALWSQKTWIGGNGAWNEGTNWNPTGVPVTNSLITFNDGTAITVTNVPTIALRRITVTANTALTLQGATNNTVTLNNRSGTELAINAGSSLVIGSGFNLVLGPASTSNIAGTLRINNGSAYDTENNNTAVTNTGIIDNAGLIETNNNNISFAGGAIYIHSQNGGEVPDADWNANSNCVIAGVINAMPTGFNQDFANFEWNCPDQVPFTIGFPSFAGNLGDIEGDLVITNTGTGALYLAYDARFSTFVSGNYIQTGGTFVITQFGGQGALYIDGNFNMSGGVLARNSPVSGDNSSTIHFSGNGEQTFTKTGGTISGPLDFEVDDGAIVNFGTSVLDGSTGNFMLHDGTKMITSHPDGLNSAGALGSIQTTSRLFSSNADYEFRGPVTGIFNTGGSTNSQPSIVRNLIINNPSGAVTLSKPVTISSDQPGIQRLYLQNGALITTPTNILTLEDDVRATGVAALSSNQYNLNSFVDGPLRKIGNDEFIFPVGKVGFGLHKIGISAPFGGSNNTTSFTARFFKSDPHVLSNKLDAELKKLSACEYWTLERGGVDGTNAVRVTLSWESNSGCGGQYVTEPLSLSVARLDATGTWVNEEQTNRLVTPTAGTVTSNTIADFSPFALASTSATENPLPVVFGDVKAYEKNNGVQIEWSNLTEKDVAEYTIERSVNGRDFNAISSQLPTSNQDDRADYDAFDANPVQGTNYYRIKAEETTGKIVYSKILSVGIGNDAQGLRLYPNPVKDNQVTISLSNMKRGSYNLRVVNTAGQDVFKKIILNQSSSLTQTLDLPSTIKPGVYNMVITTDGYRETKIFIVQ